MFYSTNMVINFLSSRIMRHPQVTSSRPNTEQGIMFLDSTSSFVALQEGSKGRIEVKIIVQKVTKY